MNTYKITFQRENGTEGFDHFTEPTEAAARKAFNECYRHGNGTIKSIELVNDNASATKEQERKALEKIRKIVAELGPQSYVATAFEGCFRDAEDNIEDDAAYSMKSRFEYSEEKLEKAQEDVKALEIEVDNRKAVIYELTTENNKLKAKTLTTAEAGAIKEILSHSKFEAADLVDSSAQRIVELADNPDSAEFRQAVQDNRQSKKRLAECDTLIQKLIRIMQ